MESIAGVKLESINLKKTMTFEKSFIKNAIEPEDTAADTYIGIKSWETKILELERINIQLL